MAIPSYTPTEWENGVTLINEDNLNKIEGQLEVITDEKDIQTATGTSLTLTDCVADTCKVTSNSKNLFDKDNPTPVYYANNASYSILENGIRITKPSSGATSVVFRIMDVSDKVGETFTLKANFTSGGQYILGLCDASGGNRIIGTIGTTGGAEINYTIPTITTSSYLAIWLYGDSDTTGNKDYTNIQLEQGSTATSYNPYNTEVLVTEKNVFDESQIVSGALTQGVIGSSQYTITGDYISVENGKTYTLSFDYDTLSNSGQRAIDFFNSNKVFSTEETYLPTTKTHTFTAPLDGYVRISLDKNCVKIQLEQGSTATAYSDEQQYLTLLPQEEKPAISYNNKTIVVSNGSVTIEYNTQSRLLNNDDVLDIVEPVKEYIDRETEETYSTTEVKTNKTWIDGKPIYRKVITYNYAEGSTTASIPTGISNLGKVVLLNPIMLRSASDFEINYYSSSSDYLRTFYRYSTNAIEVRSSAASPNTVFYITIEYTKTTD